jgi:hypothetical protein
LDLDVDFLELDLALDLDLDLDLDLALDLDLDLGLDLALDLGLDFLELDLGLELLNPEFLNNIFFDNSSIWFDKLFDELFTNVFKFSKVRG